MRYKKGTLYYIESTCRRLEIRYDIENDRFIPEHEDRAELMKWYIDHFLIGLGRCIDLELKDMVKRNIISEEHKTKYKTKKEST